MAVSRANESWIKMMIKIRKRMIKSKSRGRMPAFDLTGTRNLALKPLPNLNPTPTPTPTPTLTLTPPAFFPFCFSIPSDKEPW